MHASIVRVVVGDATALRRTTDGFDRVLLDPPCSGLGTLRSHPDLRWRVTPRAIDAAGRRAGRAARRRAGARCAPAGALVYSVCTLSPAEERLPAPGAVRTLPHEDGTDGFYIAR